MNKYIFSTLVLCLVFPASVHAATLSLVPSSGSVASGQTLSVGINVSSPGQAMNAASGVVSFPTDKLEVISLSKANSIATLWVQEPSFSNAAGTISFEGVVLNPGFSGASGRFLTIMFRAKSEGTATLSFGSGSVLANDGQGTEIFSGSSGSSISIVRAQVVPPPSPKPAPVQAPTPAPEQKEEIEKKNLELAIITDVTERVMPGEVAEVKGTSVYPGARAYLTLSKGEKKIELETIVTQNGTFSFTQPNMGIDPGDYAGTVVIKRDDAQSLPASSFVISFEEESFVATLIEFLKQPFVMVLGAFALAFALGIFSTRFFFGHNHHNKGMREVLRDVDVEVHKAFLTLRNRINEALEDLEKESATRELTAAEKRFVHEMTSTIKEAEKTVEKDIKEAGK